MSRAAAHLVDLVIPHVPVRQWILSLPIALRLLLAAQPELVTPVLQALQRLTSTKKDAAGRSCPGFNPMAQHDATLFNSVVAGEHGLHGSTNRDIRSRLTGTRWLRACADDPKKASAKVGRCFRPLHAHGLIAEIPHTRRWRVTDYGRKVMGTTMYRREHHFPNVYSGVMH